MPKGWETESIMAQSSGPSREHSDHGRKRLFLLLLLIVISVFFVAYLGWHLIDHEEKVLERNEAVLEAIAEHEEELHRQRANEEEELTKEMQQIFRENKARDDEVVASTMGDGEDGGDLVVDTTNTDHVTPEYYLSEDKLVDRKRRPTKSRLSKHKYFASKTGEAEKANSEDAEDKEDYEFWNNSQNTER